MVQARILIFGDSIAYGAWDHEGGWADKIKSLFHKQNLVMPDSKIQVYNLGIGGDTSTTLLDRIESEIVARKSSDWPAYIVLAIGLNDVRTMAATGVRPISQDEFRENVGLIIDLAKKHADDADEITKVIVVGLTQVQHARTTFKRYTYSQTDVVAYDNILQSLAQDAGVSYCPLTKFLHEAALPKSGVYHHDGVHPNTNGHQLIFQDVIGAIKNQWQL